MQLSSLRALRPDTQIALASMVVALCSLALTVVFTLQQRRHERLTVMPVVAPSLGASASKAWIVVGNDGLGPAHVQAFQVHLDGRPVKSWVDLANALDPNGTARWGFTNVANAYLPPNHLREVFVTEDPSLIQKMSEASSRISFTVCYCSLYEECWLRVTGRHRIQVDNCAEPSRESVRQGLAIPAPASGASR
jgi:hypothetical protein